MQAEFCDCGAHVVYSVRWDAFYCPTCNKWLEGRCYDDECEFCAERPLEPQPESETTP
jgi:hypothetical protein